MRYTWKLGLAIGFAAAAALVVAPLAMAGVVSSNHDMTWKYPTSPKAGACSHCHIPHKAGGDKLWASTYTAGTGWQSETISQLCYTCHGTTTYTNALEVNPFAGGNHHGRTVASLTSMGDIASMPSDVPLSGSDLKCTSCHDVHSNNNRPFLRPFGTMAASTFNFQQYCQHCHPRRANSTPLRGTANIIAAGGNYSQHPTDQLFAGNARAAFGTIDTSFAINPGDPAVPGVIGGNAAYNLGGHRNDGTATGNFTCATCHAVHGDETNVYSSTTNGGSTVGTANTGWNALNVLNPNPLTAAPYMEPVCVGCHANGATSGPGAAGTISHPIGTASSTWAVTNVAYPTDSVWGGSNDVIVCQSCHDIHYAQPGTSLLLGPIDTPSATSNANCNACHATSTIANHHPANRVMPAQMMTDRTNAETGDMDWAALTQSNGGAAYQFGTGNVMTCGTCHNGAASGAHNNSGSTFPALVGWNVNSEMCVDCHSYNPSLYSTVVNHGPVSATVTANASHYVGTIASAAYRRTAAWGTTGLSSKWGPSNNYIICESCHTLKLSGTISGPTVSNNTAVAGYVRDNHGLLLERNGNLRTVYNADATGTNADLCTGCHGGSPTGGQAGSGNRTHPTLSNWTTAATAAITTRIAAQPTGTVSVNGSTQINCESCHRPHDAASGSGALILEGCGTDSNKLAGGLQGVAFDRATGNLGANYTNESTFCNMCHNY